MQQLWSDLRNMWSSFRGGSRWVAVGVLGAMVTAVALIVILGQTADYRALYVNMAPEDAGSVTQYLSGQGIKYEVRSGGTAVYVPADVVENARVALAQQGLPRQSVGYDIFDQGGFAQSEAQLRINQQRALQGELERTLVKIEGIQGARVLIAQGQDSLFKTDQTPPTASVLLKSSSALSAAQVRAVVHLVSKAVPRLKPENIAITDTFNNNYDAIVQGLSGSGGSAYQLEVQRTYETGLARDIQERFLFPVFGPGKAVVKVSAEFDWNKYEATETSLGDEPVVISRESKETTFKGAGSTTGGVPGAGSNLPTTGGSTRSGGNNQDFTETTTTVNSDVSKKVETIARQPGVLKRQSVSVILDVAPSDAAIERVRQAIQAASGFDLSRGDQVIVVGQSFDRSASTTAEKKMEQDAQAAAQSRQFQNIAAAALLVAVVLFAFMRLRSRGGGGASSIDSMRLPTELAAAADVELPFDVPQTARPAGTDAQGLGDSQRRAFERLKDAKRNEALRQRSDRSDFIEGFARERPNEFAEVVRSLLREANRE